MIHLMLLTGDGSSFRSFRFLPQEPSFTSGAMCRRNYDKNYTVVEDKFDGTRTDPYHYPNGLGVLETDHYADLRSGNRDP